MVFDEAIFRSISDSVPFSCYLKRMDDFELSMEIERIQEVNILPLHDVLNATMSVFAAHFWKVNTYDFRELPATDIPFDLRIPISIDVILIKSSSSEIVAEFFVYQGTVDLSEIMLSLKSIYV